MQDPMNAVTQKMRALAFEQDSAILSAMLDGLLDGVIAIRADGMIALFNPAAERIFGYTADEVISKHLTMLMPEPHKSEHNRYVSNYLQTGVAKVVGIGREVVGLPSSGEEFAMELAVSEIPGSKEPMFVGIVRDISERKATERELSFNHEMLDSISTIQSRFILDGNTAAAFERLLSQILKVTESEYGFIGEVLHTDDGSRYLKTHAITNIAWNDETRRFYEENAPQGLEFFNLDTLFGAVIRSGSTVIANDPANDPRAGGIPEGHPPMHGFLGIPFLIGTRLAGMVGVANRPVGYD